MYAEVAELADAHDSKSCGLTPLWVRFPPSALGNYPEKHHNIFHVPPPLFVLFFIYQFWGETDFILNENGMARGPAIGLSLASVAAGFIIALFITWVIWPVEYTNADPSDLRSSYKEDYVRMISTAYQMDGNLARAKSRLAQLKLGNPAQFANTLASREKQPGKTALLNLSQALAGIPVSQRPTPGPTLGSLPTLALTPTREVPAFRLVERTLLSCADDAEAALLRVFVRDSQGRDLPDVGVEVRWSTGDDTIYTGLKPERGVGFADFEVVPDTYSVTVQSYKSANVSSDTAAGLAVGEPPANCRADRGTTPRGWKLVFQLSSTYP